MLMNKIGVTQLELRHTGRRGFTLSVRSKLQKKDPVAWNNLGAVDYMDGRLCDSDLQLQPCHQAEQDSRLFTTPTSRRLSLRRRNTRMRGSSSKLRCNLIQTWRTTMERAE